jgi:hypothetical protein
MSGKKPSGRDAQQRLGYEGVVIRLLRKCCPEAVLTGASRRWMASSLCELGRAPGRKLPDEGAAGIIARTRAAEV